jgi:hypothetical protein
MYEVSPAYKNLGSQSDAWLFSELEIQINTARVRRSPPVQHRDPSGMRQTAHNIMALVTELERRGHQIENSRIQPYL